MSVKKYIKKPVTIEAIQYTGDNADDIKKFITNHCILLNNGKIIIDTLEGNIYASIGDYIIKGIAGEFYPCKPDIFNKTYDLID